jgi:hypothetical protein
MHNDELCCGYVRYCLFPSAPLELMCRNIGELEVLWSGVGFLPVSGFLPIIFEQLSLNIKADYWGCGPFSLFVILKIENDVSKTGSFTVLKRKEEDTLLDRLGRANLNHWTIRLPVQVQVILRLKVSWPVCPGIRPPSGTSDQFFFLSTDIIFRYLLFFLYGAPPVTNARICNLLVQVLLGLASTVILASESRKTWDHILLPHLRVRSLCADSYHPQGYGGGILCFLHSRIPDDGQSPEPK